VGVRFGGSEHHRIETSSSHTRPPPYWAGAPGHRDTASGTPRGARRTVPPRQGTAPLRRNGPPTSPGRRKRSSSEPRAPSLTGVRQPALFGASRVGPHRGREPPAPRSRRPPTSPGQGNRISSEARSPRLDPGQSLPPIGVGHPAHRGQADGTLRGAASRASSGRSKRSSSEPRAPRLTGAGNRTSSEERPPTSPGHSNRSSSERRAPRLTGQGTGGSSEPSAPHPPGQGTASSSEPTAPHPAGAGRPDLLGGPGPPVPPRARIAPPHRDRATGAPRSPARLVPPGWVPRPSGAGQTDLFGGPRAPPRRDRANGALRSLARRVPPGQGTASSSEPTAPHPTGTGNRPSSESRPPTPPRGRVPRLTGQGRRHSSERRELRLTGPTHTELFGAPRAATHRGRVPRALRSNGGPVAFEAGKLVSQGHRPPSPSGQGSSATRG
jgi:hypothetical protein